MSRSLLSILFFLFPLLTIGKGKESKYPFSTCGRHVVDNSGYRFKLIGVNWYGASDELNIVHGLDKAKMEDIIKSIKKLGFNTVRLPFSNQMLDEKKVDPKYLKANPHLIGKTPLEIFDEVIKALAKEDLAIILNNHTSISMWCCLYEENGLWYTKDYPEERWISDWEFLVERYKNIPQVVGVDLRNEVRVASWKGSGIPTFPFWGSGTKNDWKRAAQIAGNRVLKKNPNILVIVEGMNFPRYHLRGVPKHPIQLIKPSQLVYGVHNYAFTSPTIRGTAGLGKKYGDMEWDEFSDLMEEEWGFVLELGPGLQAPVWVSEIGLGPSDSKKWWNNIIRYLKEKDADFAYWPLNASPKADGTEETFALLEDDWVTPKNDWRVNLLGTISKSLTPWSKEKAESCKNQDYRVLMMDQTDAFDGKEPKDWKPNSLKGSCSEESRMVGLGLESKLARRGVKSILCSRKNWNMKVKNHFVLANDQKDSKFSGARTKKDWAPGYNKLECPRGQFITGVSQERKGFSLRVTGVRCSEGGASLLGSNHCEARKFKKGDNRGDPKPGDWQVGSYKGQCRDTEFVAGLSLKRGRPNSILCCK